MEGELSDAQLREQIWNRVRIALARHFDTDGNLLPKSGFWGAFERHTEGFGDLKAGVLKLNFPYPRPADRRGNGKAISIATRTGLLKYLAKPLPNVRQSLRRPCIPGFEEVNQEFLDTQKALHAGEFTALDFYLHRYHAQWWGIANGYGVKRGPIDKVVAHIRMAMTHDLPIKAVLAGPGGFGKSTMARMVADELKDDFQIVWVEDDQVKDLLEVDREEWLPDPAHARRIIVLDNLSEGDLRALGERLKWMHREEHGRRLGFLVTMRIPGEIPTAYRDAQAIFNLDDSASMEEVGNDGKRVSALQLDNERLVEKLFEVFTAFLPEPSELVILRAIVDKLDFARSNPFHLCYFLIRALQEEDLGMMVKAAKMPTAEAYFHAIIEAELDKVRSEGKWGTAVVEAITFTAQVQHVYGETLDWRTFKLLVLQFGYPDRNEEEALVQATIFGHRQLRYIVTLAEEVVGRHKTKKIRFNHDAFRDFLSKGTLPNPEAWRFRLFSLLKAGHDPRVFRSILNARAEEDRFLTQEDCRQLLDIWIDRDCENTGYQVSITSGSSLLPINLSERKGYFERLFHLRNKNVEAFLHGFSFAGPSEKVPWSRLFLDKEFWAPMEIPKEVISACFTSLTPEEQTCKAAEFLEKEFWTSKTIPFQVIGTCFSYLPPEERTRKTAEFLDKEFLAPREIRKDLNSARLPSLAPEEQFRTNQELLEMQWWASRENPGDVIRSCFPFLAPEEQIRRAAEFLEKEFWARKEIPDQVFVTCFSYLKSDAKLEKAKMWLKEDFWLDRIVPSKVLTLVCTDLGSKVAKEARQLLNSGTITDRWALINLAYAAGDCPATREVLRLTFSSLSLRHKALSFCMPYDLHWQAAAYVVLSNRKIFTRALSKAMQHFPLHAGLLSRTCGEILFSWESEMEYLESNYPIDYGYLVTALRHPDWKALGKETAGRILSFLEPRQVPWGHPFWELKQICENIYAGTDDKPSHHSKCSCAEYYESLGRR